MRTVPLSGCRTVHRMCSKVVLPAPLGPSSANNSSRRTSKLMSVQRDCAAVALGNMIDLDCGDHRGTGAPGKFASFRMPAMVPSAVSEAIA